jgi:hypothetical protein
MIRFPIPLVLVGFYLASACATLCRTPCGVVVTEGDCRALAHYEGRVTERLSQEVPEWADAKVCRALEGWTVRVRPHDDKLDKGCGLSAWRRPPAPDGGVGDCVIGLTDFDTKTITLSSSDWVPSAFAHEVAHVAGHELTQDRGHCRWNRRFKAVLGDLNGRGDWSDPEPECSH